jgi:beta-glucosidase
MTAACHFRMKPLLFTCLSALAALTSFPAMAQETAPSPCGKSFVFTGEIKHFKTKPDAQVQGATRPDFYVEEVYGKSFTATVAGLPEGRYTIEIFLAEAYHHAPGERVMNISVGDQKLAGDLDLFAKAGFAREHIVSGTVEHKEDQILGPLAIRFDATKGHAKFNAIKVKNATGDEVACVQAKDLAGVEMARASAIPQVKDPAIYLDWKQPVGKRVADLVRRMSLKEKVAQLMNAAPAIERLKVPAYDYWNECLHGVARAGKATVFPQAIGMAATWDPAKLKQVADVIATEGRAKNNEARETNPDTARYWGLTFWTPNINIFRDPRWGRGHETYGEDPFLTSRLAVSFIQGLQGDDPKYLKAVACAKHYAVHSGPEKLRHTFDAVPSKRDLWETYLPQFEAAVREGKVQNVMSAYNAVYGVPAPASAFLLTEVLRKKWGFDGHVVSDCAGIHDTWANHHYVETPEGAAAVTIKAGNDLECGGTNAALVKAVNLDLVSEEEIDTALTRVLKARFQLGLFDAPEACAYLRIPKTENDTPAHSQLALEMACESLVLLKNDGVLPLDKAKVKRIALIGPNADSVTVLLGNYNGTPSNPVTLRAGLTAECGPQIEVAYAPGCPIAAKADETLGTDTPEFQKALKLAASADVVIFAGGINAQMEGEEMPTKFEGFDRGDRVKIELPAIQTELLKALKQTGKPVVLVNFSGSSMAMPWEAENLPAILQAWYPGQNGGTALADVLFGKSNPAGRLPVTFYRSTGDLPPFEDYSMARRTYRYFDGKVLYPFGHGLSYTRFEYGKPTASKVSPEGKVTVSLDVKNTGDRDGEEVVHLYVQHLDSKIPQPIHSLAAFKRVAIKSGATQRVELDVPARALRYWDEAKNDYVVPRGEFEIQIGASSADIRKTLKLATGSSLRRT